MTDDVKINDLYLKTEKTATKKKILALIKYLNHKNN